MHILIHPVYFGNIVHYVAMAQADSVTFEMYDHYQKQTYRNRCYIATATGKHTLNIPIKHTSSGERGSRTVAHQNYKDVRIENSFPWQKTHWKTLQAAYRSSPFFEFYEDDFAPLFEKKHEFLMDFNRECFAIIAELLPLDFTPEMTTVYHKEVVDKTDLRHLVNTKRETPVFLEPYTQVLEKNHGFLPNLSILDLLFNEGTNSLSYLERQVLY